MKPASSINRSLAHAGYQLIEWLGPRLRLRTAFRLAEHLADIQWRRSPRVREAVETNLSRLLEIAVPDQVAIGQEVFRNFARYLVEFFAIQRAELPALDIEGRAHLEQCRADAHGAILLTGHLGNWELGAACIRRLGLPVTVVALPHADPRTDRLFTRQRQRCGLNAIPLGAQVVGRCLRSLKAGNLLGMPGDWDVTGAGLPVPFGSGSLVMPRGPAVLSLRSGAPVLPVFLIREGRWAFRLFVEPPIWPDGDQTGEAVVRSLTRRYADVLERYVRRFPEQWLVFHEAVVPLRYQSGPEWASLPGLPTAPVWAMVGRPRTTAGAVSDLDNGNHGTVLRSHPGR